MAQPLALILSLSPCTSQLELLNVSRELLSILDVATFDSTRQCQAMPPIKPIRVLKSHSYFNSPACTHTNFSGSTKDGKMVEFASMSSTNA